MYVKYMFWQTYVLKNACLGALLDVRKTCVYERILNMRYSIYTFTMR